MLRKFGCLTSIVYMSTLLILNAQSIQTDEVDRKSTLKKLEEQKDRSLNIRKLMTIKESNEYEDVGSRDYWFYSQRAFPYEEIPAGAHINAMRNTINMEKILDEKKLKYSLQATNNWEEIGPVNQGGRIRGFAIHPTKSGTIYAGGIYGGVWKTTDGGDSWKTNFDKMESLNISDIAIDFTNPDIVYACTGEFPISVATPNTYSGTGVYKTIDGGLNWKNIGLSNVSSSSKIIVHKTKPNIIYVGGVNTNAGFYRSIDAGLTWSKIATGMQVQDMAVNPTNNDEVYITNNGSIKKSVDAGVTFVTSSSGVSSGNRSAITVCESNPNIVYALIAHANDTADYADVYKSTNKGINWTKTITSPRESNTGGRGWFNGQTFHNFYIAVYPNDENILFVGGIDIYRSTNGGTSFSNMTDYYKQRDDPNTVHADQMTMKFDPDQPEVIFASNDGGLYVSVDGGDKYSSITTKLPITQFYRLGIDQTRNFRVFGGSQDNGSWGSVGTTSFNKNWINMSGGDGFYTVVDPQEPDFIFTETPNGEGIRRVEIASPKTNSTGLTGIDDQGEWESPLEVSPVNFAIYSGQKALWRSERQGFKKLNSGNSGTITAVGLSPINKDLIAVASRGGQVRVSSDYGENWKTSTGTPSRFARDLEYDPNELNRIYYTVSGYGSGHVFRSDDGGTSFKNISGNLPDAPVSTIQIDPKNNNHLFVGTDVGVFVSLDGGGSWQPFNDGLARSPVTDLKIHNLSRSLIACTHGRSMWKVSIDNIEPQVSFIYPNGGEQLSSPGKMNVKVSGFNTPIKIYISYDGGFSFDLVGDNIQPTGDSILLPFTKTKNAKIKVVEISSNREIFSNNFTINAKPNCLNVSTKLHQLEAIEIRKDELWGTYESSDGKDSMFVYSMSNFTLIKSFQISNIDNKIIDLAYNSSKDEFYGLSSKSDFSNSKIYKIDTTGNPSLITGVTSTSLNGITFTPLGLAITSPGENGKMSILNPVDGSVLQPETAISGLIGNKRLSLSFDGSSFIQGVKDRLSNAIFPNELHQIYAKNPPQFRKFVPFVITGGESPDVLGIAYNEADKSYLISTLTGLYKVGLTDYFGRVYFTSKNVNAGIVKVNSISPNPTNNFANLNFDLKISQNIKINLYDNLGVKVAELLNDKIDSGVKDLKFNTSSYSSGLYFITIETDLQKVVSSLVIVK